MHFATTPSPPYYAVIFTSAKTADVEGYAETAAAMEALAKKQAGYLGIETAQGITVSYWQNLANIKGWKLQLDHLAAQQQGQKQWYSAYKVRICKVERAYGFEA
jgi:heme-degrading monooxygenase HmoA